MRWIYLFAGMLVLTGIMSGCTTEEKPKSEDEVFKEYVRLIGESAPLMKEADDLIYESGVAVKDGNFDIAVKKLEKAKELNNNVKNNCILAMNIIKDNELKEYAKYCTLIANYSIKLIEEDIKVIECLSKNNKSCVKERMKIGETYKNKIINLDKQSHDLYLKLKKEGKL